ncbi:MAG TPA: TfoX/Sxy family protein [Gammaproteobacteria bacterium]|nr:TfoX/Sxy family protein [Gammaproteobacteria bacterium]
MDEYVEYLIELFELFGPVTARKMFGGYGLYRGGFMFGLVGYGRLYLKADEILEDPEEAALWARRSFEAAVRAAAAKGTSR